MATVRLNPRSPYWIAVFRRADGRQTNRSTRLKATEANRRKALAIAERFEEAFQSGQTRAQIQRVMADASEIAVGKRIVSPTLGEFLGSWIDRIREEVSPRTYAKYAGVASRFREWVGDDLQVIDVTRETLTSYRSELANRFATSTVNTAVKILRQAFADAIRDGLITDNPADIRALKSRGDSVAREPFSEPELAAMWAATENAPEWRGMLLLGLYTGQRLKDLATLRWAQVDLEKSEIRLQTGKTGRRQLILMAGPLRDWMLANLSPGDDPGALLFPVFAPVLSHQASGWLSNSFRRDVMTPAGVGRPIPGQRVNPKSFHSLRHTLPSLLAETGVSQQTIAEIVGHDSMAMSWHYTHISRDEIQRAVDGLRNPFQ